MHTEKEKESRRKYKKKHPEPHRKHSKTYREKHKAEIAEYNRLNPELRTRLPLEVHKALKAVPGGIRGMIDREIAKLDLDPEEEKLRSKVQKILDKTA